jgi:Protein of unknown function (DUF524)./Domain of unknown function (DUF2357).
MNNAFELLIVTQNQEILLQFGRYWNEKEDIPVIPENVNCELIIKCSNNKGMPQAYFGGHQLDNPYLFDKDENYLSWKWSSEQYFRNCFGILVFRISFEELEEVYEFPPIEVIATKIKADEAKNMLQYLFDCDPNLLYACFARTSSTSAWGEKSPNIERVIYAANQVITAIEKLIFSSMRRVRTRLVETEKVKVIEKSDIIDDRSIRFIIENLDQASSLYNPNSVSLKFRGRAFYFEKLQVIRKTESTDVYENSIIHGVIKSVKSRLHLTTQQLKKVLSEIESHMLKDVHEGMSDYVQFKTVCGYFIHKVSNHSFQVIEDLLKRLSLIEFNARRIIPAKPIIKVPRLTPFFSVNNVYRPIYNSSLNWYKIGDGISEISNLLFGLKTLDRLYEYVCLIKLIDIFTQEGWVIKESKLIGRYEFETEYTNNYYLFHHERLGFLELRYEPEISSSPDSSLWDLIKISGSKKFPYRPDFVLRFKNINKEEKVRIVLDAKYSTDYVIWENRLPSIIMKYLHGVRRINELQKLPFDHLWALGPTEKELKSFHHRNKESRAINPSIGVVQVKPNNSLDGLRKFYRKVIIPDIFS